MRQRSATQGVGQAGIAGFRLGLAAMDRIDVERGLARTLWHHRHRRDLARKQRVKHGFDLLQHGAHVADGAVAKERHRAMRDAAFGFDLGPPHAAVAKADPILVQRFRDDDMLDMGEMALRRQIGNAAIAAGFFIGSSGNLDAAVVIGVGCDEGFRRDDTGRKPALHVARPAAINAVGLQRTAKWIAGPAVANLDHIVMAVEMHAFTGGSALMAGDQVPAWINVAIARRARGTDELGGKARSGQPCPKIIADFTVIAPRRIKRWDADQTLRQRDKIFAAAVNFAKQAVMRHGASLPCRRDIGNAKSRFLDDAGDVIWHDFPQIERKYRPVEGMMADFDAQIRESQEQVAKAQAKISDITGRIEAAHAKVAAGEAVIDIENATLEDVHQHTDLMNANIAELIMGLDDVTAGFSKDFDEMRSKTGMESFIGIFSDAKSESMRQERLRGGID